MYERATIIKPVRRQRIVAMICTKDGFIISEGWCQMKTHPLQKQFGGDKKIYLHAEIDAIANALRLTAENDGFRNLIMYVLRLKNSKEIGDARPCECCRGALMKFNISKVEWTKGVTNGEGDVVLRGQKNRVSDSVDAFDL
jgi:deoxycytidylate deaminase